ncbi:kinase-like domain-containing protein [Rhizoctonia solani]|nr:kinase-like domain-containing protein [Rhizoctonia solani]
MSKIASRPLDEDNTHRQKWSFLEVARHIKSHGLKGSLRNPLRQRFERGSSKTSESKAPHPSLGTGIHPPQALPSRLEVSQPSIPSPGLTGPKGCSIVTVDNSPQETALKRKVPQSPVELSISHTGRTVSASGATLEQPGLQSNNTNVDNTPGPGVGDTKSSSASFMGSQCGLSGNNGSAEIGTFGGHESRTNTPSKSIIDEVSNQPSEAYQAREPITSSGNEQVRSPVVIHEMPPKIPPATSETDLLGNAPISRQMTAAEVVSHLVKHGITDLSETLDYTTFDEHPVVTGGSSDIYRGQLKSGADVAVKVLRFVVQSFSEASENIRDAARELHTWSKCDHPNVLPLRGLVNFRSRIGMVSPWMSEGTMPCYIKANPKANRHNLCIQICEGLSYLHEKGVIQANVLVSEDGIPVLTDFGNSTLKDRTLKFTQVGNDSAFTVRWSAPEFIKDSGLSLRTKASDIYALGMVYIYEAIVGKIPYYGETELQVIIMVAMKKAPPQRPDWIRSGHESGDKLWDLLTRCWSWEPEARPSVTEVTSIIRTINIEELFV